jgi:head-tail adaptor
MRAGTLRERLRLQRTTNYLGQWGQESVWKDIATVWASVKASGGAETFGDKGVTGSTTFLVRLRYRTGLTSQDRCSQCARS